MVFMHQCMILQPGNDKSKSVACWAQNVMGVLYDVKGVKDLIRSGDNCGSICSKGINDYKMPICPQKDTQLWVTKLNMFLLWVCEPFKRLCFRFGGGAFSHFFLLVGSCLVYCGILWWIFEFKNDSANAGNTLSLEIICWTNVLCILLAQARQELQILEALFFINTVIDSFQ